MKSLKANFAYNAANQMLGILVPLVTTPYLSRILGPEKLGVFSYANSVTYYFTLFALLGLANYGGREIARVRDDREILNKTFSGIYTAQLICTLAVTIVYAVYMFIESGIMAKIYFFSVLAVALDINWLYYGMEKFDVILKRSLLVKLISTVCIFIFVREAGDVYLYSIIMVMSGILGNLVLWISVKKDITFCRVDVESIKRHLLLNLTLFLPIILTSLYRVMDKLMLKWMTDYAQVGFFESADKLGMVPLFLVSSLSQIMIPRISFLISKDKVSGVNAYFYKSMTMISILSTTVIFGMVGVADKFVPLYYGHGYEACIGLIIVILPSYIFTGYSATIRSQLLIPYGKDKEFVLSLFAGAAINLILNILLIPLFLALGSAIATAVTEISIFIITIIYSRTNISFSRLFRENWIFYFCGSIMLVALLTISTGVAGILGLVFKIIIGIVSYFIVYAVYLLLRKRRRSST